MAVVIIRLVVVFDKCKNPPSAGRQIWIRACETHDYIKKTL